MFKPGCVQALYARLTRLPSAVQQTLIYALCIALSKFLGLLLIPLTTYYLSPTDFGRLDILQTLADLLSILLGLGLCDALYRFCAKAENEEEKRKLAAGIFTLALLWGSLALIVTQVLAAWISTQLPSGVSLQQTRLILTTLALGPLIMVSLSWLRMQQQAWLFCKARLLQILAQVALAACLLYWGWGIEAILCAGLLSSLALALYLLRYMLQNVGLALPLSMCKQVLRYAAPLLIVGAAGFVLGSFDRWFLAAEIGAAAMAQYALAAKFGLITAILIQPFEMWWLPQRFSVLKASNGSERCARMAELSIIIGLFSALGVAIIGPMLVQWLTPASYHDAILYLPWMALLAVLHSANTALGLACYQQSSTRWPALIDCAAAAIAAIAYSLLIPSFDLAYGAVIATALALGLRLVATVIIGQRILRLPYALWRLSGLLVICAAALALMHDQRDPVQLLVQGALMFVVMLAYGLSSGLLPSPNHYKQLFKPSGQHA